MGYLTSVAQGLFSVLVTAGAIPVIRCEGGGGPSEIVATKLSEMIQEQPQLFSNVAGGGGGGGGEGKGDDGGSGGGGGGEGDDGEGEFGLQRPLLVILDRNVDLTSAVHHTATYQALVDDLMQVRKKEMYKPIITRPLWTT